MSYWDDGEREDTVIAEVRGDTAKGWDVRREDGWSQWLDAKYGVTPKVGDRITTWGSIGRPIRGVALNGAVIYYRTPDEQQAQDQMAADDLKAQRVAEYESKRHEYDAKVAALPGPLRDRMEAFRAWGGDSWRWEFEPYDLVCCEEAARLSAHFKNTDDLQRFAKLDYAEQKAEYPQMEGGHSGNTWGMSVRLAHWMLTAPENVVREHAAICPLVGCEDVGCPSVRTPRGESVS